jgi:hypothetical protein
MHLDMLKNEHFEHIMALLNSFGYFKPDILLYHHYFGKKPVIFFYFFFLTFYEFISIIIMILFNLIQIHIILGYSKFINIK